MSIGLAFATFRAAGLERARFEQAFRAASPLASYERALKELPLLQGMPEYDEAEEELRCCKIWIEREPTVWFGGMASNHHANFRTLLERGLRRKEVDRARDARSAGGKESGKRRRDDRRNLEIETSAQKLLAEGKSSRDLNAILAHKFSLSSKQIGNIRRDLQKKRNTETK